MAAAAACLDANEVARFEPEGILLLDRLRVGRAPLGQRKAAGFAFAPSLCPPGRAFGAVQIGTEKAWAGDPVSFAKPHAATEFAGAARILAQGKFLDAKRHQGFLEF